MHICVSIEEKKPFTGFANVIVMEGIEKNEKKERKRKRKTEKKGMV